ncbi:DUF1176 domain-containing protein [Massilia endophytica]|uniref:DUF1176 domain-containing protein n=1 Tax=Massilia endophytica TaxID=2899220 RepID=UPI001E619A86|nr:DUF1176 domain-containing protein [Massilia endophytica]UGQ47007.1 DUF1176 domain-containing protein [Massilia endophytica]
MKPLRLLTAGVIAALALPASGAGPKEKYFSHHDWELACDNTRSCRAAGYSPEGTDGAGMSVLLERNAGAAQPVRATVQLSTTDETFAQPASIAMYINGHALGTVQLSAESATGSLSPGQTEALIAALRKDSKLEWRGSGSTWSLSGKGATAMLLKMDDLQGRLGTPGALVRKGGKPETGVLSALPAPVVEAAPVATAGVKFPPAQQDTLRKLLRRTVKEGECELLGESDIEAWRLGADRLLVSAVCWRGAYNEGSGYWVINSKAPYAPVLVTDLGTGYADGVISASHRGRGLGDCRSMDDWTWDGMRFVHTLQATTGMCRMVALGGAWELPTLTAEVRRGAR